MNPLSPAVVTSASLKKRISKSDPNVPAGLRSVLALYDELKQSGADFRVLTQRSPEMLNKVSGDMEEYLRPLLRRKMTTRLVEGPSSETGESVTKDITAATAKKLSYLQTELVRFVGEALGLSDMNQVFPPLVTEFSGRYTHRYNKNKSSGIIEELMWRPLVVSFTPFRDTQNAENQNTVYIVSEARREIMVMGKTCHYLPLKGLEESFFVTAFLTLGQLAFHLSGRASSFEFEDIPSTCSMQEVKQWNAWMEGRKCAFAADQILFFVDGVLVSNRLSTVLNVLFALAPSGDSLRECLNSFKETNDAIGDIFAREGADSTLVFMNALRSLNFFKQRHTIEFIVLEKFSYSALECQFPCGCVQKKCVPTVQEVLEEYNVQPYCGPTHLYTDIREDIDQRYPAFRLLQSLTLATQECGKDSGLYSPTVASSASFGSTDGERRFSSALIHDMYSQMTAFMFPPILSYVLSELQEKKTLDSHAVSFAVWNYPLIFPFEMRVTLLEMLISSKRRVSARIMKMVRSFSRKEIRQHFFGLHWLDGDRNKENPRIQLVVNRKKIGDSLGFLQLFSTCPFPIDVSFKEEKGIGPGPALEYYELVAKYLSSPSLGLFKTMEVTLPDGSVEVQTCPLLFPECKDPLFHSLEYEYLGCLLARLLILRRTTIVRFHPLFLAAIRGDNINDPSKLSENMLLLDPVIEKSLRQIEALSAADLAAMDLRFTIDVSGKEYGLKKDGANTVVTKENVKSYADSVRKFHTSFSIRVAAHKVRLGLATLINLEYLSLFSIAELDVIFSGSQGKVWDTPAAFAKDVVTSHGYTRQSSVVVDFLDLIPSWDATLQRQFLKFLTGSSTLPISGRLSMPITIVRRDDAVTSAIRPSVPPPMEPRVSRPTSAANSPARARARSHGHRRDTSGLDDGGEPQSARRSRSEARPPPEPEPLAAAAQKEVDRMLPTVSTCFNYFKLPCYSSKKILEKQLKTAILEGQGAFMLT
ncbi:E3 ubiquitin-protein ligase TRIP12 [Angomonas deanei]|uniref:HECT-domain (Ubiquitin-transferase), putative n=1 Tax=Angomonas deanei TaxID=59799 RepID=A0A7G2C2S6_9TRYP|nr:E3 ubiquitin-protein ligase TRIP12 [Angomonas deanei]CAD2212997.1 HECT-domain (ubiquitin-transferase), putative [Angomonas deanei]|eukprot:EPY19585.1 E3 ubiquitin-protein ligase TRIP12 [Angomonas deanei]